MGDEGGGAEGIATDTKDKEWKEGRDCNFCIMKDVREDGIARYLDN